MPMYPVRLLQFHPDTDLKAVQGIQYVCSTVIRWEPYVSNKGAVQCHPCHRLATVLQTATWSQYVWNVVKFTKRKNVRRRQKTNQRVSTASVNFLSSTGNAISSSSTRIKHLLTQTHFLSRLLKKPSQPTRAQPIKAQKKLREHKHPSHLYHSNQKLFGIVILTSTNSTTIQRSRNIPQTLQHRGLACQAREDKPNAPYLQTRWRKMNDNT